MLLSNNGECQLDNRSCNDQGVAMSLDVSLRIEAFHSANMSQCVEFLAHKTGKEADLVIHGTASTSSSIRSGFSALLLSNSMSFSMFSLQQDLLLKNLPPNTRAHGRLARTAAQITICLRLVSMLAEEELVPIFGKFRIEHDKWEPAKTAYYDAEFRCILIQTRGMWSRSVLAR